MVPSFKKTPKAYKNKFGNLFNDYKEVKEKTIFLDTIAMTARITRILTSGRMNPTQW
jgi:hypothetical protein